MSICEIPRIDGEHGAGVVDSFAMPLNATDKAWIQQEIQQARKRVGFGKLTGFIKDWSGTGAAVAIFILFFTQWTAYTEFRVHTADRLDHIESTLLSVQAATAPKKVLGELASGSPKLLQNSLSALRTVSGKSVAEVKPSPVILQAVGKNLLRVDENAPEYWPTVLQFVQFASSAISPQAPPPNGTAGSYSTLSDVSGVDVPDHSTYKLSGRIQNERFTNSRIIFSSEGVLLRNVTFFNCVFEFEGDLDSPSPTTRETGRILLASGLQNAYVSGI